MNTNSNSLINCRRTSTSTRSSCEWTVAQGLGWVIWLRNCWQRPGVLGNSHRLNINRFYRFRFIGPGSDFSASSKWMENIKSCTRPDEKFYYSCLFSGIRHVVTCSYLLYYGQTKQKLQMCWKSLTSQIYKPIIVSTNLVIMQGLD